MYTWAFWSGGSVLVSMCKSRTVEERRSCYCQADFAVDFQFVMTAGAIAVANGLFHSQ